MSNIIKSRQVTTKGKFILNPSIKNEEINEKNKKTDYISESLESEIKKNAEKKRNEIIRLAQEEAERIISEAINKSKEIEEEADSKIEDFKQKAEEEGYNKGFVLGKTEGISNGRELVEGLINGLEEMVNNFYIDLDKRTPKLKKDIIRLVISISKKVIKRELQLDEELIKNTIESTIKLLDGEEEVKIRLNPNDLEILGDYKEELLSAKNHFEKVKMIVDESIARGGCIIESDFGGFDATIDSQLKDIENKLLEVISDE